MSWLDNCGVIAELLELLLHLSEKVKEALNSNMLLKAHGLCHLPAGWREKAGLQDVAVHVDNAEG